MKWNDPARLENPMKSTKATSEIIGEELDRIGTLGEIHFAKLSANAKLKCSEVRPDKTGKDFIVEKSLAPGSPTRPLDKRPPPLQVVAQVKTILAKNRTASISLSVAERLAKDLRPSVVCVFRIHEDDSILQMAFIHLLDDHLARVLESLRRASGRGRVAPHKKTMSFNVPSDAWVDASAVEFSRIVEGLPGESMSSYAEKKRLQLDQLGFDSSRLTMKFTLNVSSEDELANAFIGLHPVEASQVNMFETRFSIQLPLEDVSGRGTLHFSPEHETPAKLEVLSGDDDGHVAIDANLAMIGPPFVSEANIMFSAQTALGSVIMGGGRWTYRYPHGLSDESPHTAAFWLEYFRLHTILSTGQFTVILTADGRPPLPMAVDDPGSRDKAAASYVRLFEKIGAVLTAVNMDEHPFPLRLARKDSHELLFLRRAIDKADGHFSVQDDFDPPLKLSDDKSAYVSAVNVLGIWIGIYFPMRLTTRSVESGREIVGRQFSPAVLEALNPLKLENHFERFREKCLSLDGATSVFVQMPGDFAGDAVQLLDLTEPTEDGAASYASGSA